MRDCNREGGENGPRQIGGTMNEAQRKVQGIKFVGKRRGV